MYIVTGKAVNRSNEILTPEAIAVYDTIKGAEMVGLWKVVRKGLDWFRRHYAREYMILLD